MIPNSQVNFPKAPSKFIFLSSFKIPWWARQCFESTLDLYLFCHPLDEMLLKRLFCPYTYFEGPVSFKKSLSWNKVERKKWYWVLCSKVNRRSIIFFILICKPRTKYLIISLAKETDQVGFHIMKISVLLYARPDLIAHQELLPHLIKAEQFLWNNE